MNGNDKSNVTIGLPKEGGALFCAPLGTALPTSANAALSEEFFCLGYVTEDGVTISTAEEGDDIKAWGAETVMHSQTSYGKTANFNLLETSKPAVLQFMYGKDNVHVGEDGNISWDETGETLPHVVLVCDTLHNNGSDTPKIHRTILGDAQFTDRSGDHTYNNSDPLSFPVVLTAYKFNDNGKDKYAINYMEKVTSIATE